MVLWLLRFLILHMLTCCPLCCGPLHVWEQGGSTRWVHKESVALVIALGRRTAESIQLVITQLQDMKPRKSHATCAYRRQPFSKFSHASVTWDERMLIIFIIMREGRGCKLQCHAWQIKKRILIYKDLMAKKHQCLSTEQPMQKWCHICTLLQHSVENMIYVC